MDKIYVGFFLSFLVGGIIVWLYFKTIFAKTRVRRADFDDLNSSFRNAVVEKVKLEEQISSIQGHVEHLNEQLKKANEDLSRTKDINKE